jgi:hypothetical protein
MRSSTCVFYKLGALQIVWISGKGLIEVGMGPRPASTSACARQQPRHFPARWCQTAVAAPMVLDVRHPRFWPPRSLPPATALSFCSWAREAPHNTPSSLTPMLIAPPHSVACSAAPTPPIVATRVQPSEVLPKMFSNPVWSSLSSRATTWSRTTMRSCNEEPPPSSATEGSLLPGLFGHGATP